MTAAAALLREHPVAVEVAVVSRHSTAPRMGMENELNQLISPVHEALAHMDKAVPVVIEKTLILPAV